MATNGIVHDNPSGNEYFNYTRNKERNPEDSFSYSLIIHILTRDLL